MTEQKPDLRINLEPGEILFRQGDPGGDLYIIDDGEVEIFQVDNGKPVVLARMSKGEVLGIMTCLNSEPRLASARAKTKAVIRKIPSKNIASVMENIPDWMNVVIKEFTTRLRNMNKMYTETKLQVDRLVKTQANSLYLATQVAGCVATLGELLARQAEEEKIVFVEELFTRLEIVLAHPREQLDRIWNIFCEVGLIHVAIEPERKAKIIKMSNAKKLPYFIEFVRNFQRGKMKELQNVKFAHKDLRVIIGLTKVAKHLNKDLSKDVEISIEQFTELLPRVTNVKFEISAVEMIQRLGLATIRGGEAGVVRFNPTTVGRTVGSLEAIRRINALDQPVSEKAQSAA